MRAALGVIVAFAAMGALVFALSIAPWFIFGVDAVLEPGGFESSTAINAYAVTVGLAGALFAGWLCAAIGRSSMAVFVLAALCVAGGAVNAGQRQKPEPGAREAGVSVMEAVARRKEAGWFTLLMPCLGAAGVIVGGRRLLHLK